MRFQLKLRSFFFLVITAGLIALTIFLGRVVYSDLYRKILLTFDQKLLAASTVVAAFVSGEDHNEIVQLTQLRGIVASNGQIYGRHAVSPGLIRMNPRTGNVARMDLDPEPYYTEDIAMGDGMLFATTPEGENPETESEDPTIIEEMSLPAITRIDPRTGKTSVFARLDDYCRAIAYLKGYLYCAGEVLSRIEVTPEGAGPVEEIAAMDAVITGLAPTADGDYLIAIDSNEEVEDGEIVKPRRFILLDPADGSTHRSIPILSADGNSYYPFGVFSVTFDPLSGKYFGASTAALLEIDLESGRVSEKKGIGFGPPAAQQTYSNLVRPMIRVRKGTDITFLYSAVLVDRETYINYALDSTQSDIHSFVGFADSNQADDDIRDVILKREIYLSPIADWEDWGLLKSAYIPILNEQGDAVAYAGADVNIDIIESQTRTALVQVVLIGVVALMAGLIIAYFIAQRLTSPIQKLKQSALRVAAGDFGTRIHVENPAELTHLSSSLTRLSESLDETVTSLTGENFRLEEKRRRNELVSLIQSFMKHRSSIEFSSGKDNLVHGNLEDARFLVIWATAEEDPVRAAQISSDLFRMSRRLLQQKVEDWRKGVEPLVGRVIRFALLIQRDSGQVTCLVENPSRLYLVSEKGKVARHAVEENGQVADEKSLKGIYFVEGTDKDDLEDQLRGEVKRRLEELKADLPDRPILEVIL